MKLFIIPLVALSLTGCATITKIETTKAPSLARIYQLRSSYDAAFLAPAANYRRLGICVPPAKPTMSAPCASRSLVLKLQTVDQKAQHALDDLETFSRAHPGDLGAQGLYDAASLVIKEAEGIVTTNNLK